MSQPEEDAIQSEVSEYKTDESREERLETAQEIGEAVRLLAESIVTHYDGRAGEAEWSALRRLCQVSERAGIETKKENVDGLELPEDVKTRVKEVIPDAGVVGAGQANIPIPDEFEDDAYQFLRTLVESEDPEVLDKAIDEFASLGLKGVQSGVVSPIIYFLHPSRYPILNNESAETMASILDSGVSTDLVDYTREAERFRAFSDRYGLGGDTGDLRDLDWFLYQLDGSGSQVFLVLLTSEMREYFGQTVLSEVTPDVFEDVIGVDVSRGDVRFWVSATVVTAVQPGDVVLFVDRDEDAVVATGEVQQYDALAEESAKRLFDNMGWESEDVNRHVLVFDRVHDAQYSGAELRRVLDYDEFPQNGFTRVHPTRVDEHVLENSAFGSIDAFLDSFRGKKLYPQEDIDVKELTERVPSDVSFYWVNQTYGEELEGEFLRSQDRKWQRDLTVLERGDVVFHYTDKAIRACSVVTAEAYQNEYRGEQHDFVDVETTWFDDPVDVEAIKTGLRHPDVKRGQVRYPVTDSESILQAYLCYLTPEAGAYLLEVVGVECPTVESEQKYFWVNTKQTDWQEPGEQLFYSTTKASGDEWLNQEAFERAQPGDEVIVYEMSPTKQVVGRATVVQGVHERTSSDGEAVEGITLEWSESLDGVPWREIKSDSELASSEVVTSNKHYVLTELREHEYERILELSERVTYSEFEEDLAVPASEIVVESNELYFPDEEWDRIKARVEQALANGNHVLFFGPPGTGKTKLARQVCEETVDDGNYELVTASADWSTFDTVGGYQTTTENTLEFEPGVVLDRFQADGEGIPANEWLIIDELNRADIDKAFGSLFSALTGESVTLPFEESNGEAIQILDASREDEIVVSNKFFIPEDWRMLATMNTLDKTSLYEMSYAFMRRWAFIPIGIPELPDDEEALEELVAGYVDVWAEHGNVPKAAHHYGTVGRIWRAVNEERAIGPAIVEDIYEYVAGAESGGHADYVSPIIMYVFPQLEGLRRGELEHVISQLDEIVVDESNESGELWTVARDFFQVELQPSDEG